MSSINEEHSRDCLFLMEENENDSTNQTGKKSKKENVKLERSDILALIIAIFWQLLPIIIFSIVLMVVTYILLYLMSQNALGLVLAKR